jgi:pimeloyl-ACP methyl ester carboxylesterase
VAESSATRMMLPNGAEMLLNAPLLGSGGTGGKDCVLLLTGTSTQLEDVRLFTDFLARQGRAVAAVERFIGGPFDIGYDPRKERAETLKAALAYLQETLKVERIQVVAHSYATFEITRLLSEAPGKYAHGIDNIILVNPAGFSGKKRFVRHCLRFVFLMILRENCRLAARLLLNRNGKAESRQLWKRKLSAAASLFLKTIYNPSKTFKEVADVVSYQVKPSLQKLIQSGNYRFHAFINTDDNLVAPEESLRELQDLLPARSLLTCPGCHMDLFVDTDQMHRFSAYLTDIMERTC